LFDMPKEIALRGVDLALEYFKESAQIGFFGGEPSLCLDLIEEVAHYAKTKAKEQKKTIAFELTTNGTLLTQRFIDVVKKYSMMVAVSIDGDQETQNTHRTFAGGRGSFEKINAGLDRLLQELPWAVAYSVVTPKTAPRLAASTKFLLERGFKILVAWPAHSAPWTNQDAEILSAQWREISKMYLKASRQNNKVYFSAFDGVIKSHIRGGDGDCGAGRDHLSVSATGKIYPCVQFVGDEADPRWVIGDVTEGLDPEKLASFPWLQERSEECGPCQLSSRCASRCPCANLSATGDPRRVSPIQCAIQQMVIPLADEVAEKLYQERNSLFLHKQYNRLYPVAHCVEALVQKESKQ
jgi:uncharacterized protein